MTLKPLHIAFLLTLLGLASCAAPAPLEDCAQKPRNLSAGALEAEICSKCIWNDTGIKIRRGRLYDLKPSGTWVDWFLTCDASGPVSLFGRTVMHLSRSGLRFPPGRDRRAHFFSLVVCPWSTSSLPRDLPAEAFLLPAEGITGWAAPVDGRLLAFANDWGSAYGNNKGALRLRVSEAQLNVPRR